jgi:hypothetical protein
MRFLQQNILNRPGSVLLCGLLGLVGMPSRVEAAASPAMRDSRSGQPVANAGPPKSVFVIPSGPQEGKDPFFPKSSRVYLSEKPVVPTNNFVAPTPQQTFDLKLNGISGTAEHRLAIINGKTFEKDEEGEVRVGAAKVNIRVVEITANSATVQVGARQQVLHMRGNY